MMKILNGLSVVIVGLFVFDKVNKLCNEGLSIKILK
jgi:hypothetical protein